jgi:hypothetical protein
VPLNDERENSDSPYSGAARTATDTAHVEHVQAVLQQTCSISCTSMDSELEVGILQVCSATLPKTQGNRICAKWQ